MFSLLSRNSFWLLLARLGTQAGMALFTILLARQIGSTAFGEYAFIAAVVVIGNTLTTFGTDMLLIREIAALNDLPRLFPALVLQLAFSVLFIIVVFIASLSLPNQSPEAASALRIYSLSLLPLAFFTVFTTALRGKQHMGPYALINLALMVLQVAAVLWLIWMHGDLIALAIMLSSVQVIGGLLAGALCSIKIPHFWHNWHSPIQQMFPLLRASAPIALLALLGILYQRLGLILLPLLGGATVTGWFAAAGRVVEAAKTGHVAVFTALYPLMAQFNSADKSNWSRNFRLPWFLLLAGAMIASIILYVIASPLITILYGSGYVSSIPLLRILAWILIPYTVNMFLSLAFLARRQETVIMRALLVGLLSLAVLTVWWEPLAGSAGMAWAVVSAESLQAVYLLSAQASQSSSEMRAKGQAHELPDLP